MALCSAQVAVKPEPELPPPGLHPVASLEDVSASLEDVSLTLPGALDDPGATGPGAFVWDPVLKPARDGLEDVEDEPEEVFRFVSGDAGPDEWDPFSKTVAISGPGVWVCVGSWDALRRGTGGLPPAAGGQPLPCVQAQRKLWLL